jgi:hypothetical protein
MGQQHRRQSEQRGRRPRQYVKSNPSSFYSGIGFANDISITNQTRYWGQGVAEKGNEIKDSVGIGGPRISTAGNPLGIAGQGAGKGSAPGGKVEKGVRNAGKGSGTNPLGLA